MNIKYITYLISGLFLFFLLPSCNSDDTVSYSSQTNDAQIYSFSIKGEFYKFQDSTQRAMDSIRFLQINKTKYAIDQVSGTIYNPDSLPYGTVLRNKVYVSASYNPTYGAAGVKVIIPDSLSGFNWNNTDSLNFSKRPITFIVTSLGGPVKSYNIDIRIHKVDPDTISWKQMESYPVSIGKSKTLLVDNNKFYTYSVQNGSVSLFTSDRTSLNWLSKTISGLPSTIKPETIFNMNGVFYGVLDNGDSYKSNDGLLWENANNGKVINSIVGVLPAEVSSADELLVTINDGGKYYFGKTKDMVSVEVVDYLSVSPTNNQVPSSFPIQGEASYTSYSTDRNKRMLILNGGLGTTGADINYTWFIKNTTQGLDLTPSAKNTLFQGAGLSNTLYDGKLYVLAENQFYISNTWGANWYKAPNKQKLDPSMAKRSGQTLIVDTENNIWIFGGVSTDGTYLNDVWRGRLNKLN